MTDLLSPVSPGEVLFEEFLTPLAMSEIGLAQDIGVPADCITEIVSGKRAITADTAARFAQCFGTSDRFWLNLQARYDASGRTDAS